MSTPASILFAGGGTGGHIFPNMAIAERLHEAKAPFKAIFVVSDRKIDADIMAKHKLDFIALPAKPFSANPLKWFDFYRGFATSEGIIAQAIKEQNARAIVATGGFVSPPVATAAKKAGIPVVLVNLDAVPGKANKLICKSATQVFSAYPMIEAPTAQIVGVPLRQVAIGPADKDKARTAFGLLPGRETLFVTGASLGASSINQLMLEIITQPGVKKELGAWQVIHLTGGTAQQAKEIEAAYDKASIPARVEPFCNQMGMAWAAASLGISRAGASSVAEAWANSVPCFFLPYPYHKDQHQRKNAEPLAKIGSALIYDDLIDPSKNARQLAGPLVSVMTNATRRSQMVSLMRDRIPPDGALSVSRWLLRHVK
jgi:UDP-N-acetylglucosamine--N-acetylmuramyl-(pentapeptide) pyrophosphoryl-undecaprenol N-acetylglucosamine transferase